MFPISLDLSLMSVMLVGNGEKTVRRWELLAEAGATQVTLYSPAPIEELRKKAGTHIVERLPDAEDCEGKRIMMVVDIAETEAASLAAMARKHHLLVNVEDNTPLCDFHFMSMVRRGDLLLTVSTGGKSPALAARIRRLLETLFPEHWKERLEEIGVQRKAWKAQGLSFQQVLEKSEEFIEEKGWLPEVNNQKSEKMLTSNF